MRSRSCGREDLPISGWGRIANSADDSASIDGLTVRKGYTFGCRFLDACSKDRFYAALA